MSTENGADEVTAPAWLNEEFIQDLIRREDDPNISVALEGIDLAIGKGVNFLSIIYRVKLKCTTEGSSYLKTLIVKCPPHDKMAEEFGKEIASFKKEIDMYENVIPKMFKIWEKRTGQNSFAISPRCYPSSMDDTLILEDLQPLGFRMAEKSKLCDLEHTLVVLRKMAKFHAMSLATLVEDPLSFKHSKESFFSEDNKIFKEVLTKQIQKKIETIRELSEYEHIAKKLEKSDQIIKLVFEISKPRDTSLSVLNHGDCWINNMVFRYSSETGIVEDMRFLDFQLSRYASPTLDLNHFLFSSVDDDVLKDRDTLLAEYHSTLIKHLQESGCEHTKYSLEDLKRDFQERMLYGWMVTSLRETILSDPEAVPTFTEMLDHKEDTCGMSVNPGSSPVYQKSLRFLIPEFERAGVFESL
uniref:CHK kinase-like domain-containing protein n=1 Tax=Timema tahoe TaxID=61484 RepID=A0A7R9FJR4_9NEOP|nr:unnamed protein product [Timema tahoe]